MGDGIEDRRRRAEDMHREAGVNWRYWGEVRFKQLTLFLTLTGALVVAVLHERIRDTAEEPIMAALGIFLAIAFFLLEERATYYRRAFVEVAKSIERKRLVLPLYHATKNRCKLGSDWIYRMFFAMVVGMWSISIEAYRKDGEPAASTGLISAFVATVLFSLIGMFLQGSRQSRALPALETSLNGPTKGPKNELPTDDEEDTG